MRDDIDILLITHDPKETSVMLQQVWPARRSLIIDAKHASTGMGDGHASGIEEACEKA